jgi:hypothetical protein
MVSLASFINWRLLFNQEMKDLAVFVLAGIAAGFGIVKYQSQIEAKRRAREISTKPLERPDPPTLSRAEAAAIAERQYKAMNRPGVNTNELFTSLNRLNGADLRQVYDAFGMRKYSLFTGPLDLLGWYVNELNYQELNRMRIIWYKAGVTF